MRKVATIFIIVLLATTHFISGVAASSLDNYGDKSIQLSIDSAYTTAYKKSNKTTAVRCCDKQSPRHHSTGSHCIADCGAVVGVAGANFLDFKQIPEFAASPLINSEKFCFLFRPPIV